MLINSKNLSLVVFIFISLYFANNYLEISIENTLPINDELGYIGEGIHLRDISYDFREIINRNRTPLLPLVISFLAQSKSSLSQYSQEYMKLYRESQIAIILIVCFVNFFSFLKMKKRFKFNYIILFFFVYLYSIPLTAQIREVLVEPIFMSLYLLFIITVFEVKDSNNKKEYVIMGFVGGILFLAKFTGFLIFIFSIASIGLYKLLMEKKHNALMNFKNLVISFLTFTFFGLPYIIANLSDGLNPFYSVNSKIIWYSSWPEAYEYIKMYDGNFGFKNIPDELAPSLNYFLQNNGGFSGLFKRIESGTNLLRKDFSNFYDLAGETTILFMTLIILIFVILVFINKENFKITFKNNLFEMFYVISLSMILLIGFTIYSPISNDNRLYLYTTIPIIFLLFYLLDQLLSLFQSTSNSLMKIQNIVFLILLYLYLVLIEPFWFFLHPLGFILSKIQMVLG